MKRSTISKFAETFPTLKDVRRKDVQGWINGLIADEGKKPKTVTRILSELRGYWKYLVALELASVDPDPFANLVMPQGSKKDVASGDHWQPFTAQQVVDLLKAAKAKKTDPALADLITLGMWTGGRIDSLCALKIEDIKDDHFTILDDKTAAGRRDVPIHSKLKPTIERLIGKRKTGFLIEKTTIERGAKGENKYASRSDAIGKRFGKLKAAMKFGRVHVFHSIRKTVVTLLENAGVSENVTADIVGHEKPRITYGLYSGGNDVSVMKAAIEKLSYPGM
jgi:integrase